MTDQAPPTLTFTGKNGAHRYRIDDRIVTSVTTIINGGIPKPTLKTWYATTVAEYVADHWSGPDMAALARGGRDPMVKFLAGIPDQRRDDAAAQGSAVHTLAEDVVHGRPVEVPAVLADKVEGYARWLDRSGAARVLVETIVGHRTLRYGGRFDLLAYIGPDLWLLDLKTAKGVYGETSCQLAAYARAEFMVDPQGHEGQVVPLPEVDRMGVLHVSDDGTDLYDMGDVEDGWREFQAALTIYRGNARRDRLGSYRATPLDLP